MLKSGKITGNHITSGFKLHSTNNDVISGIYPIDGTEFYADIKNNLIESVYRYDNFKTVNGLTFLMMVNQFGNVFIGSKIKDYDPSFIPPETPTPVYNYLNNQIVIIVDSNGFVKKIKELEIPLTLFLMIIATIIIISLILANNS